MSAEGHRPTPHRGPAAARPPRTGPRDLALVAVGGALGAVARVALARAAPTAADAFPWTTFLENVGGAFALGLVLTLLLRRLSADPALRLLLCTGALGAFTTYSTLADEVGTRLLDGHTALAVAYAVASVAAGLTAALAGMALGRTIASRTGPPDLAGTAR